MKERFKRPVVCGLISTIVSVPLTFFLLNLYVALTVSVGHGGLIDRMIDAACIAVGFAAFCSGFLSSYYSMEAEN